MTAISALSDINGYIAQLMSLERKRGPLALYEQDQQALNRRAATLADLRTNLNALNTAAQALAQPGALSPFEAKSVTSSAGTVVTATATASAAPGSHSLFVAQLARADTLTSRRFVDAGTELVAAEGAGTKTVRITVDGSDYDVNVALAAGDTDETVLLNLAAAINAHAGASAKVTASVVQVDETGSRLVLRGKQTGLAHALALSDQSGSLFASADVRDGAAADEEANRGGYLYADDLLDARFVLDGLTLTRSGNSVTDALPGVTLQLLGAQSAGATDVTLTVAADETAIRARVQTFLDSYNTLVRFLTERTSTTVSSTTSATGSTSVNSITRGTLDAEPIYLTLLFGLRADVGGRIGTAASGGPAALSEAGITAASDGTLSISDPAKFSAALASPAGISALFNSSDGLSTRIQNRLTAFVETGGILDGSQAAVTSRLTGVGLAIQQQETLLKVKEEGLRQQLTGLQELLAQLAQQQSVLDSITAASSLL